MPNITLQGNYVQNNLKNYEPVIFAGGTGPWEGTPTITGTFSLLNCYKKPVGSLDVFDVVDEVTFGPDTEVKLIGELGSRHLLRLEASLNPIRPLGPENDYIRIVGVNGEVARAKKQA